MILEGKRSNYPSASNIIDQFSQSICGRLMMLLEREGKNLCSLRHIWCQIEFDLVLILEILIFLFCS